MTKQFLTTRVSTIAVEQEFSVGDNILDATRFFLSPDLIQPQACLDDWTKT